MGGYLHSITQVLSPLLPHRWTRMVMMMQTRLLPRLARRHLHWILQRPHRQIHPFAPTLRRTHASHGLRTRLARLWHQWHFILAHSKRQRSVRRTSHSQRLPLPSVQRARQAVGTHRSISGLALPHAGRTRLLGQA